MNIDAEGYEILILESNDWNRYRLLVISTEALGKDDTPPVSALFRRGAKTLWYVVEEVTETSLHRFLCSKGFRLFAKGIVTCICVDRNQAKL